MVASTARNALTAFWLIDDSFSANYRNYMYNYFAMEWSLCAIYLPPRLGHKIGRSATPLTSSLRAYHSVFFQSTHWPSWGPLECMQITFTELALFNKNNNFKLTFLWKRPRELRYSCTCAATLTDFFRLMKSGALFQQVVNSLQAFMKYKKSSWGISGVRTRLPSKHQNWRIVCENRV